jgi:hypothetical protein
MSDKWQIRKMPKRVCDYQPARKDVEFAMGPPHLARNLELRFSTYRRAKDIAAGLESES